MASTVVGLFDDHDAARRAIDELRSRGFDSNKVSVVAADQEGAFQRRHVDDQGNEAAGGAATGLASGAVVGGILGLLVGMGAIFVPGGVLVAGPLAGLVTGVAAGAATGGLLGGLIGMGIPKEHADVYAEGIRRGGVLLAVDATDREEDAVSVMERSGAVDIDERAEQYRREGFTHYDENATPYTTNRSHADRIDGTTPAENLGTDMEGLNTNTGTTDGPALGQQGITRGSMTDSYTGMNLGAGTGSLAMPSNMSGNPGDAGSLHTVDEADIVGMTDNDIRLPEGSGVPEAKPMGGDLQEGAADSLVEPTNAFVAPPPQEIRQPGFESLGSTPGSVGFMAGATTGSPPTVPGTTPSIDAVEADASAAGTMGEGLNQEPRTDFGTPKASDPMPTTSGTVGTMGTTMEAPMVTGTLGQGQVSTGEVGQDNTSGLPKSDTNTNDGPPPMEDFRDEYDRRFSNLGMTYEQALPAFEFGHSMAQRNDLKDREWGAAEQALRDDWESRNPGTWIMYRDIARVGWDRMMTRTRDGKASMM